LIAGLRQMLIYEWLIIMFFILIQHS